MAPFDYALGLLTMLMGLALAVVTLCLHKLFGTRPYPALASA